MLLKNIVTLLAILPAIVTTSQVHQKISLLDYGEGGRYGLKKCQDKGQNPGGVSCINFDSIQTNATTGLGEVPIDYTGLVFSPQFSAINITTVTSELPPQNEHSAQPSPNALIGSRYNPKNKNDTSLASFSSKKGTFDLFGFYIQPMGSPSPGASIYVRGYRSDGERPFMFNLSFLSSTKGPYYFDSLRDVGPKKWDELKKVEIWASYGEDEADWEFFVDDLWLRWGNEPKPDRREQHCGELK